MFIEVKSATLIALVSCLANPVLADVSSRLVADSLMVDLDRSATIEGEERTSSYRFEWRARDLEFSSTWTGALELFSHEVHGRTRNDGTSQYIAGAVWQFSIEPEQLVYPVRVRPWMPELDVYRIWVSCADRVDCIHMRGVTRPTLFPIGEDPLSEQANWESFEENNPMMPFAVGSCDAANEVAAQLNALLAEQGAVFDAEAESEPCEAMAQM